MGISFFKSFGLGKLLRLNVSRRGVGVSFGPRGASVSVGRRGTFFNLSPLPGSGIRFRERLNRPGKVKVPDLRNNPEVAKILGTRFKGDRGRGIGEIMTVADACMVDGEARVYVRFDGDKRSQGYSTAEFVERFGQFEQVK
jgi:hypothetical protein